MYIYICIHTGSNGGTNTRILGDSVIGRTRVSAFHHRNLGK